MTSNVTSVYIHVVDDVINKVRDEFINNGAGESVLNELQELWETKMLQCGAIGDAIVRPPVPRPAGTITPVHDLNVPYEGPLEEYETPTAEMLFPPTPLQTPIQTPLPGTEYNIPTGPTDYIPINDIRNGADVKVGRPPPYMQPSSPWMNQRPPLGVDVNVAYVEGRDEVDRGVSHQPMTQDFFMMSSGKRKRDDYASHLTPGGYMPQQDGSGDVAIEFSLPETPLQTPIQTLLPGTVDQSMYNIPTGPTDYTPINDIRNDADVKVERPPPYMQPSSPWMNQRPSLGVDVNMAYAEGRDEVDRGVSHQPMTQDFFMMSSEKRKRDDYSSHLTPGGYIPQQDGSRDVTIEFSLPEASRVQHPLARQGWETATAGAPSIQEAGAAPVLPQQDGINDDYDDMFHFQGVASEDYNTPADHGELRAATPTVATPKPAKSEAVDDDEPPLNEDDDDDEDLDDFEQGEEEPNTQHLVLAQFDKEVTRTKSRWKCILKDGIMHLNGRDILFNKATGEFDF